MLTICEIVGLGFLLLMIIGVICVFIHDKKRWNKGICGICGKGKHKSIDSCGGIAYQCSNCKNIWWTSGWVKFEEIDNIKEQLRANKLETLTND
jgi:hypothetical protein